MVKTYPVHSISNQWWSVCYIIEIIDIIVIILISNGYTQLSNL